MNLTYVKNNNDRIYPKFVIFSAYKDSLSEAQNVERTELVINDIKRLGLNYKLVDGVYKGQAETSIYVEVPSLDDFAEVHEIATLLEQESILNVDQNRQATLIFLITGSSIQLGEFKQTSEQVARTHDCYTYDHENNAYYICE